MKLSPAEYVIHVFGGVRATARAIGVTPTSISKWTRREEGTVPTSKMKKIIKKAELLGLDITPDDLVLGREVDPSELRYNGS